MLEGIVTTVSGAMLEVEFVRGKMFVFMLEFKPNFTAGLFCA